MEKYKKAWLNAGLLVLTLIVNGLGATGFINGLSQKEISDRFITLITPSPKTFSIWSLIYLLLIISIALLIIKKKDNYYMKALDEITPLFQLSCVLNILWIIAFSYVQLLLSSIFIFAYVIILSMICTRLIKIHERKKFILPLTFGLYTGWLFIATVVNVSATLVKLNWNGFGLAEEVWAIITLLIAILLVLLVNQSIKNAGFPLPIAWAYLGIYEFLNAKEGFDGAYPLLSTVALIRMTILIGTAAIRFYLNGFKVIPSGLDE